MLGSPSSSGKNHHPNLTKEGSVLSFYLLDSKEPFPQVSQVTGLNSAQTWCSPSHFQWGVHQDRLWATMSAYKTGTSRMKEEV